MKKLIARAGSELVRRRFTTTAELLRFLNESLIQYLRDSGIITTREFDAIPCEDVGLDDIAPDKVRQFLERAKSERNYLLAVDSTLETALAHLDLLVDGRPTRGAVLLFGKRPKAHVLGADVNCLHFHGTQIVKPIPSQQVYEGTVFDMVDAAVDFVMSKLARTVLPSSETVASDVQYEIPYRVVREAIVNALAHRSYTSNAGVQVMLFTDRLEVWNPGGLPEGLTIDQLRKPHRSVPRNRLLCEPLYLTRYIERAGTGTLDMIRLCAEAGLPEPEFRNEGEQFVTAIQRPVTEDAEEVGQRPSGQIKGQADPLNDLLNQIRTSPGVPYKVLAESLEVSEATIKRNIQKLKQQQRIRRVGSKKTGHWEVVDRD